MRRGRERCAGQGTAHSPRDPGRPGSCGSAGLSRRDGACPEGAERVPGVPRVSRGCPAEQEPCRQQRAPPCPPGGRGPAASRSPSLPRRARLRCRRRPGRGSRRGGGGAEACGRVYCCRLAPSSVFLHAVTRRASFPLLSRKPQPRYHISEAIVCAHHQNRHGFRLKKCNCTTKKERTGFMLFGADEKVYVKSPNVRKISYTQVRL